MKNVKNWGGNLLLRYTLGENELVNAGSAYHGLLITTEVQQTTISDHNLYLKKAQTWRNNGKNASDRLDERMIRIHAKKYWYKLYEIGGKVYVIYKKEKGKKKSTKYMIKVGSIIKRYEITISI